MSLRVIYEEKAIDQAAEFSPMIPPVSVHYWIPSTGWPVNLARPIRYRTGHRICDGCGPAGTG